MSEQGRDLRRGARRGPAARLRRGRPDARRGRHRRRPQAGDPGPDRLRRRPCRSRPSSAAASPALTPTDIRFAARAGLHDQAAGRGLAARTSSWRCTSRRCCSRTDAAGPGARRLQRHPRGRRRGRRHALSTARGGADADGQRRGRRPDRHGGRPGAADVPDAASSGRGSRRRLHAAAGRPRCAAGSTCGSRSPTGPACWPTIARVLARAPDQHRVGDPARGARRARGQLGAAGHHDAHGHRRATSAGRRVDRRLDHAGASVWGGRLALCWYYPVAD